MGLYDFMKAFFPKQASQSPRTRDERVGAHLFKVSLSSVKRYARMVPFIVNSRQARPTCRGDEGCAPLPDQSPLWCKTQPMARPAQQIAEAA
jgi:hypothetical protein